MPHTMPSLPQSFLTRQSSSALSFPSYHGSPTHDMDDKVADILLIEEENSDHGTDPSCRSEDSDRDSTQVDDGPGDEDHLIWALADDLDSDASTQNGGDNEEAQEALLEQLVRRTEAMRNPAAHTASFYAQSEVSDDDENSFGIDEPYSESLIEDGIQFSDEGRCVRFQAYRK